MGLAYDDKNVALENGMSTFDTVIRIENWSHQRIGLVRRPP